MSQEKLAFMRRLRRIPEDKRWTRAEIPHVIVLMSLLLRYAERVRTQFQFFRLYGKCRYQQPPGFALVLFLDGRTHLPSRVDSWRLDFSRFFLSLGALPASLFQYLDGFGYIEVSECVTEERWACSLELLRPAMFYK